MSDEEREALITDVEQANAGTQLTCPCTYCGERRNAKLLTAECRRLIGDVAAMRAALDKIASWREGPEWNTMFQEPNAAKIARDTLSLAADKGGKSPE